MRYLFYFIVSAGLFWGGMNVVQANSSSAAVSVYVVQLPSFTPPGGSYTNTQSIVLYAAGALSVHYTMDGSVPTCLTGLIYESPVSIPSSRVLKAIACYTGGNTSSVATHAYTISSPSGSSGAVYNGGSAAGSSPYTIAPNNPPSGSTTTPSGSTGSGDLPASIPPTLTPNPTGTLPDASLIDPFTRDLARGMTHADVRRLQLVLQERGFFPKNVQVTNYFGPVTYNAVMAFQRAYKIAPVIGRVGPLTRGVLNKLPAIR